MDNIFRNVDVGNVNKNKNIEAQADGIFRNVGFCDSGTHTNCLNDNEDVAADAFLPYFAEVSLASALFRNKAFCNNVFTKKMCANEDVTAEEEEGDGKKGCATDAR